MVAEIYKEQGNGSHSGSFEDTPFGKIFYQLAREKKTGLLDICTSAPPEGKVIKRLAIQSGTSFFVQGGAAEETLARILVSQGKLTEQAYASLKEQAAGDYKKLDELAFQESHLSPADFEPLYQYQTELKVRNCFALVRGYYQFRPTDAEAVKKYLLLPVNPEKILLSAVAANYPQNRIDKEFPGLDKKSFTVKPELAQDLNRFGFNPKESRWLTGLGKQFSFANALLSSALKPEESAHILLALFFAGYLELPDGQDDFPLGKAYAGAVAAREEKEAGEKKAAVEKKAVEDKKAEEKKEAKKEEARLPIEDLLDKEMTNGQLLKEIDKMIEQAHKRETTFFDLLGVAETTSPAQVKKIYFKMARIFHPDAKPDFYKGEVRDKVEELFTKIGEAYSTIIDSELKKDYINRLKSKVTDAEMEQANRAIQAEMEFQRATIAIRRGSFKEAVTALETVIALEPDEPEYKIYMGYCQFKTQGPGSVAKSAKMIEEALKARPKVVEGWYFLGMIYRVSGEPGKARDYFSKALELDKYHQESQRELRVIEMKLADEGKKGKKKK